MAKPPAGNGLGAFSCRPGRPRASASSEKETGHGDHRSSGHGQARSPRRWRRWRGTRSSSPRDHPRAGGQGHDRHPQQPEPQTARRRHRRGPAHQGECLHRHLERHRRHRGRDRQGACRRGGGRRHADGALRRRRPGRHPARGAGGDQPAGGQCAALPGLLRGHAPLRPPRQARRGAALRADRAAVRRRHELHGHPLRHQPVHHRAAARSRGTATAAWSPRAAPSWSPG